MALLVRFDSILGFRRQLPLNVDELLGQLITAGIDVGRSCRRCTGANRPLTVASGDTASQRGDRWALSRAHPSTRHYGNQCASCDRASPQRHARPSLTQSSENAQRLKFDPPQMVSGSGKPHAAKGSQRQEDLHKNAEFTFVLNGVQWAKRVGQSARSLPGGWDAA
jgi:hypothetical protein